MSKTTLEEWLIQHITKHPNITFGSLYRDALHLKLDLTHMIFEQPSINVNQWD